MTKPVDASAVLPTEVTKTLSKLTEAGDRGSPSAAAAAAASSASASASTNKVVVAVYPFTAIEPGDLTLDKGDDYIVLDDSQDHWWQVSYTVRYCNTIWWSLRVCIKIICRIKPSKSLN